MSENETLQFVAKHIKHHSNRVCNSYIRKDKKLIYALNCPHEDIRKTIITSKRSKKIIKVRVKWKEKKTMKSKSVLDNFNVIANFFAFYFFFSNWK